MAAMDGYEVARRLRALPGGNATLLIAITGYGDDDAVARSRAAGLDKHLVNWNPRGPGARRRSRRPVEQPYQRRGLMSRAAPPRS